MAATPIITAFNSGELSPMLSGRVDLDRYARGCEILENFIPLPYGGATRRPGTKAIAEVKTSAMKTRVVPFIFGVTQAYMLEFGNLYMRVHKDSAPVVTTVLNTVHACDSAVGWGMAGWDSVSADAADKMEGAASLVATTTAPREVSVLVMFYDLGAGGVDWSADEYLKFYIKRKDIPPGAKFSFKFGETGYPQNVLAFPNPANDTWVLQVCSIRGVPAADRNAARYIALSIEWPDMVTVPTGAWVKLDIIQRANETPYEIVTPWGEADLAALKFAQSADTLYAAHPSYAPRRITRTGHTAWTLTTIRFDTPPTADLPDYPATTIDPAAATGLVVNFHAGAVGTFQNGDVGRTIQGNGGKAIIVAYTDSDDVNCDIVVDFADALPIASGSWFILGPPDGYITTGPNWRKGTCTTLDTEFSCFRTTDVGKYIFVNGGCVRITSRVSATQVTAYIVRRINTPVKNDAGNYIKFRDWSIEAEQWSSDVKYKYPRTVSFYEQRLAFAGSLGFPQSIWLSRINEYENFAHGTDDDDAINATIASNEVQSIRWLLPGRVLMIGTPSGEWRCGASNVSEPLAPTNIELKNESNYGAEDIQGQRIAMSTIFVARGGRSLRELAFSFEVDSYVCTDLALLARHLFRWNRIRDMAYQREPYTTIWCVREDGQAAVCVYEKKEGVIAWYRWITEGIVESVAVIPSTTNEADEVWMVVKRGSKRFVEQVQSVEASGAVNRWYLDCALNAELTYEGSKWWCGLDHLAGQAITVAADGKSYTVTVSSLGIIEIPVFAKKVWAGIPYASNLKTMPIDMQTQGGSARSSVKSVPNMLVRFYETIGAKVGVDFSHMETIPFRTAVGGLNASELVPYTGDKILSIPAGWETQVQICVQQELPEPCTVLCVSPSLVSGGV